VKVFAKFVITFRIAFFRKREKILREFFAKYENGYLCKLKIKQFVWQPIMLKIKNQTVSKSPNVVDL
jgi:hypothetical protein